MANAFHREVLPPSASTHAIFLNLTSSSACKHLKHRGILLGQLVTARDDVLRIYHVFQADQNGATIYLAREHRIFGVVTGLEKVASSTSDKHSVDRLLVSFTDAKLALMEWCDPLNDLETVSIHTYERATALSNGLPPLFTPILNADPASSCAALLLPQDSLAILPFYQDFSELDFQDPIQNSLEAHVAQTDALPYSPSFVLAMQEVDNKIKNVKDFCFLPGFQKPTVAVLFQPLTTWTGRISAFKDTFSVCLFTIDLTASVAGQPAAHESYDDANFKSIHPVLTTSSGLPYDSLYIVPCPASLGGVMVVTMSSLLHIDQSGRIVTTALNDWFPTISNLQVKSSLKIPALNDLQNSHLTFTAPFEGILSLSDGTFYRFWCEMDGRSVDEVRVEPVYTSPDHTEENDPKFQSSSPSASVLIPGKQPYLFHASMVGPSLLLEHKKVQVQVSKKQDDADQDGQAEEQEADEMDLDDDLYGDSNPAVTKMTKSSVRYRAVLSLREVDRIDAYGPILSFARRELYSKDPRFKSQKQIVACTGVYNGAGITYFESQLTAQKRQRLETQPCSNVWSVSPFTTDDPSATARIVCVAEQQDSSELVSFNRRGEVLQVKELVDTTLACGSLRNTENRWARVTRSSLEVYHADGSVEHQIKPQADSIVHASIEDGRYACLHLSDGRFEIYEYDTETGSFRSLEIPAELSKKPVVSTCIFNDRFGKFQMAQNNAAAAPSSYANGAAVVMNGKKAVESLRTFADDDDELDDGDEEMQDEPRDESNGLDKSENPKTSQPCNLGDSCYLFVLDSEGTCELYTLPSLSLRWRNCSLPALPYRMNLEPERKYHLEDEQAVQITQAKLCHLGDKANIVALTKNGLMLVYESNPWPTGEGLVESSARPSDSDALLSLGFNKVLVSVLNQSLDDTRPTDTAVSRAGSEKTVLRPFCLQRDCEDALAIVGSGKTSSSSWLYSTTKGGLRHVDNGIDHGLRGVCSIDAVGEGEQDLVFCDGEGSIFLGFIPSDLNIDHDWPCTTFKTGRTYTKVVSHDPTGCIVAASVNLSQFVLSEEDSETVGEVSNDVTPTLAERGALELFVDGDKSEPIHGYEFEANETVNVLEIVYLDSPSLSEGRKKFVAAGTVVFYGEDRAAKGATYLFEIIEVVANQQQDPLNKFRLKLLCRDDSRAPVTAIADINGFLVSTSGQKLYVRAFEKEEWLISIAFLDLPFYITSIRIVKNLIILSDMKRSLWFLAFQEEPYRFVILSKDHNDQYATTGNFLVNQNRVSLVSTSAPSAGGPAGTGKEAVIRMFEYAPNIANSLSGQRLLLKTEYQTTSEAVESYIALGRWIPEVEEKGRELGRSKIFYAMNNGSIQTVSAVEDDDIVKRLQLLQVQLVRTVQHTCGLNPRGFRMVRNDQVSRLLTKGMLDARLVDLFTWLPRPKMLEVVKTLQGMFQGQDQIQDELQQQPEEEKKEGDDGIVVVENQMLDKEQEQQQDDLKIQQQRLKQREANERKSEAKRADLVLVDLLRLKTGLQDV